MSSSLQNYVLRTLRCFAEGTTSRRIRTTTRARAETERGLEINVNFRARARHTGDSETRGGCLPADAFIARPSLAPSSFYITVK